MSRKIFHAINKDNGGQVWLLIWTGESNAGGYAPNSSATTEELSSRQYVKLINNYTLQFENVDIGTNNLLDYQPFDDTTSHGWELGLCNDLKNGSARSPIYVVKTAQGGSKYSDWNVGGTYWNKMTARVDAAEALLASAGVSYRKVIWYSHGINDHATMSAADFKTACQAHLANLRTEFGAGIPVLMTELMNASYDDYNAKIDEMVSADANLYKIETSDCTTTREPNHWDYAGMKIIANRMLTKTLTL